MSEEKKERVLSLSEQKLEITVDRLNEWMRSWGEDFIDYHANILNGYVFAGWMIHKYPEKAFDILETINDEYFGKSVQDLMDVYEDDDDNEKFYSDFCEVVNLTITTKEKVNYILINNL